MYLQKVFVSKAEVVHSQDHAYEVREWKHCVHVC